MPEGFHGAIDDAITRLIAAIDAREPMVRVNQASSRRRAPRKAVPWSVPKRIRSLARRGWEPESIAVQMKCELKYVRRCLASKVGEHDE